MRAVFSRKEPKIEAKDLCGKKVIMLPAGEYESFTNPSMHSMILSGKCGFHV